MFCACMYALTVLGLSLDLFGHLEMVHLERLRSILDHSANFWKFLDLWLYCLDVVCDYCRIVHVCGSGACGLGGGKVVT